MLTDIHHVGLLFNGLPGECRATLHPVFQLRNRFRISKRVLTQITVAPRSHRSSEFPESHVFEAARQRMPDLSAGAGGRGESALFLETFEVDVEECGDFGGGFGVLAGDAMAAWVIVFKAIKQRHSVQVRCVRAPLLLPIALARSDETGRWLDTREYQGDGASSANRGPRGEGAKLVFPLRRPNGRRRYPRRLSGRDWR